MIICQNNGRDYIPNIVLHGFWQNLNKTDCEVRLIFFVKKTAEIRQSLYPLYGFGQLVFNSLYRLGNLGTVRAAGLCHIRTPATALTADHAGSNFDQINC